MKKIALSFAMALVVMTGLVSCGNDKYMDFVGRWGLSRLDYYNTDYAGNPIEASRQTYWFTPGDTVDGIDLVFNADKTGVMIDRSRDTLFIPIGVDLYDTILCPDTVIRTPFTYTYDETATALYMNLPSAITYRMLIKQMDAQSFTYVNQYEEHTAEEALMKRLNSDDVKASRQKAVVPHKPGSLFGN